jgi:SAM-dependent methyltransferase
MSKLQNTVALANRPTSAADFTDEPYGATTRAVWIESPGELRARIGGLADDARPPDIAVYFDNVHWASVPATAGAPGIWEMTCSIPPTIPPGKLHVVLKEAARGAALARETVEVGAPRTNPHGLPAGDVFDITAHALFSVPWFSFDGATLTITGAHLPPLGDPGLLAVEFNEGVEGVFEYPLASPEFGAHFWYWPNAHLAGFRVSINLPGSRPDADPFSFRFVTRTGARPAMAWHDNGKKRSTIWPDRGRIWIPRDIGVSMDFPSDETQLSRVQTWSNQRTVAFTGYNAFKTFESLLAHHGVAYRPGLKLLDWGCGHGRLTRHFIREWPEAHISGADIDAENIAWCHAHLSGGSFQVAPLWPELDAADGEFDAIIGLSVMTHLTEDAQAAWIRELRRILKPGGLALITFSGHGSAAYASIHQTPEWWSNWLASGFDDGQVDTALDGKIADPTYYRITHQSPRHARATWSRVMTIVDIEPQAFGYQDVAILRGR